MSEPGDTLAVGPQLGFGTSGIMGAALTRTGRLRLLHTALDHGISHFDTAPLYGRGMAEEVVGRFARGRRDQITITTKFGLAPQPIPPLLRPLLPAARLWQRRIRGRRRSGPAVTHGAAAASSPVVPPAPAPTPPPSLPYTEAAIRGSLDTSLRKLGTDHVDVLLLHECRPGQVSDAVIAVLDALVQEGKIRRYGLGTDRGSSRRILEQRPGFRGVVQIGDHLFEPDTAWFAARVGEGDLFTHGVLQEPLRTAALQPALQALTDAWAARTGEDPQRPGLLSELLLLGALLHNPHGCVLLSTSRPERIAAHGAVLQRLPELAPPLRDLLTAPPQPCS